MTPRVSFIIPCYNHARFVEQAVRSALEQSYPHVETIVVDNGSTDGSREVVSAIRGVRLLQESQRGPSAARNAGIRASTGDYLVFLDADDIVQPEFCFECVTCHAGKPDRIIHTGWIHSDNLLCDFSKKATPRFRGNLLPRLCRNNLFPIHAVFTPKPLIERVGLFDEDLSFGEDWDLWIRLARTGALWESIPKALAVYRMQSASQSRLGERSLRDALKVITRCYGRDPRVPSGRYAAGVRSSPKEAYRISVSIAALNVLAARGPAEAADLVTRYRAELDIELDPCHLADWFHCYWVARAIPETGRVSALAIYGAEIFKFLEAVDLGADKLHARLAFLDIGLKEWVRTVIVNPQGRRHLVKWCSRTLKYVLRK